MTKKEFTTIRHSLGKTQREMGSLLGLSTKAIQSFEQGWRNISGHAERQIFFLIALKNGTLNNSHSPCWEANNCPDEVKNSCPAFELKNGYFCWMINGVWCRGKDQKSWKQKMKICRKCEIFNSVVHIQHS